MYYQAIEWRARHGHGHWDCQGRGNVKYSYSPGNRFLSGKQASKQTNKNLTTNKHGRKNIILNIIYWTCSTWLRKLRKK